MLQEVFSRSLNACRTSAASDAPDRRRRARGFSMIEVLVVVAILLVLAALVVSRYQDSIRVAREGAVVANLRTIHSSQESYKQLKGTYTSNLADLQMARLLRDGDALAALQPGPLAVPREAAVLLLVSVAVPRFAFTEAQTSGSGSQTTSQTSDQGGKLTTEKKGGDTQPGDKKTGDSGGALPPPTGSSGGGSSTPTGGSSGGSGGTGGTGSTGGSSSGSSTGGTSSDGGSGAPGLPSGGGGAPSGRCSGGGSNCSTVLKAGYVYTLTLTAPDAWNCVVEPVDNRLVSKFFFTDQTGTIRFALGKYATATSSPI